MAIIYSYPLNDDIKPLDELVGTTEKSINGQLKTVTRNFLLSDLAEFFIVDGGLQKEITLTTNNSTGPATLNQVTGALNIPDYSGAIPPTPGLEQVLGVGNRAYNEIVLTFPGLGETNFNGFKTTYTDYTGRNITLFYADGSSTSGIQFILPSHKVDGRYTLATLDDIPVDFVPYTGAINNVDLGVNDIIANSFVKNGGTGTNVLLDNGTTAAISSLGSQNLQSVTDIGATTTNGIYSTVNYADEGALNGFNTNDEGTGVFGDVSGLLGAGGVFQADSGTGILAYSVSGKSIVTFGNGTVAIESNLGNSGNGLVINSGASSTGNPIVINKNGVDKLIVNQEGELTATKLIKSGGTSSQILVANGDTITAGTNITISGGTISSTVSSTPSLQQVLDFDRSLTDGKNFQGTESGTGATNAIYSNFFGAYAGNGSTNATNSNFLGSASGYVAINAYSSNFFGNSAGYEATNANFSNFIGENAGFQAASASKSNLLGWQAGFQATNAHNSNFIGQDAGFQATNASNSNLLGYRVGASFSNNNIGSNNIIIGTNISLPNATVDSINLGGILFGTGTYSNVNSTDPSIAPVSGGKIGIGVVNPTNTLHIRSETADTSGLRLERLTSSSPTSTGQAIGVDASGNIVTVEGSVASNLQEVTDIGASTTNAITANSFVKSGGTSSQILAADGSVITAGTNITITGGTISSVGGSGGGGSSVNYYLNGGTSQGTFGGTTYYEFSRTAVIGTEADFNISSNGYIASFITDIADPSLLLIPAGSWNLEFFFSSSSAGGSPSFYVELYKYDGATFTSIASSSATPEGITNGTSIDAYFTSLAVPETILTVNDRLAIRVFVNASSKTITLHTQNGHLCEVITTFTTGLTALNGLQAQVQNFATGTTGTDFDIVSSGSTHTFNLPSASATARGLVTTGTQTFAGDKTFTGGITSGTVTASSINDYGISAISQNSDGVSAESNNGNGIVGISTNATGGVFMTTNGANIAEFKTNFVEKAKIDSDGSMTAAKYLYSGGSIFPEFSQTFYINGTGSTHYFGGGVSNVQNNLEVSNGTLKIGLQTASTIASFDSSKNVVSLPLATYPSLTELSYVKGVTSAIQTQLNNKAPLISPTFTGTVVLPSTTSIGTVSSTEISYLDNVTSSIQTQLDGKVDENTAITGATKTKITYDSKGLVTAGADIATTDISDFNSATRAQVEAELVAGTNITITPSGTGATRQLTIAATGGAPSQSAFTMLANNTSASAAPTEQPFESIGNQTYTGVIAQIAAPGASGTTNHSYAFTQVGKLVSLRINIDFSSAGTNVSSMACELPSDCPAPALPTGVSASGDVINYGIGTLTANRALVGAMGISALRIKSGTVYEVVVTRTGASFSKAYYSIQYFTV